MVDIDNLLVLVMMIAGLGSAIFTLVLKNYENVSSLQHGIFNYNYNQHELLQAHKNMLLIVHEDDMWSVHGTL